MDENLDLGKNAEIQSALKEFQTKEAVAEAATVQHVQASETSGAVRWAMKISGGAIKTESQAEYFLLTLVVISIAVSIFLFAKGAGSGREFSERETERLINLPSRRGY